MTLGSRVKPLGDSRAVGKSEELRSNHVTSATQLDAEPDFRLAARQLDRLGRFVEGTLSANGFDVRAKVECRRRGVTSRR